ncbi:MAG: DNA polymerase III subunit delta [Gemmatimonadetes bacterium]|uniref:DNA-directed DNA polymerase n=1 Tax=Candidatus Kutchimonas denitrificans TaxID=3056748 RepID=A0AAE4Z807_9BACT|nr:DNA polymerase III subunit delta [Gemmatimonadota bacterium]NIR75504.1 DNA polymerase III subunit delta [Candidatus Kutchimonas denitrificans]NIS01818.1 DNA polymerase III subunit delta [Gemmatimonadota bacterium]NIT67599.1 DNA polymerase III subunit delta [Gemmatimonadota bacterium]NIU53473.1 DNA polymerase III subunit delta [Gemmatimonadota bacterium]
MGQLTYEQLRARLDRGKLGGSYFLIAEDEFLRDEAIELIAGAHLEGGSVDFDLDQLTGSEVEASALAAALGTPPMLSSYRVVVIRDGQGLVPSARSVVEEAASGSVEGRVLVLTADIGRSKAKFWDRLRKACHTVSLKTPQAAELPGWLVKRARGVHGLELETRAAQLLAAGIGARLGVLDQELEKLANFVEPSRRVGLDEVRAAVGALPQVDRWSWIDKVADRRIGEALVDLPDLLDSGESAVALIGAISESLLRVGLALEGQNAVVRVLKRDGAYRNLGWKVKTYVRQARRWNGEEIESALTELFHADRLIKSGGLAPRSALEEALLRIEALGSNGGRGTGPRGKAGGGRG